MRGESHRPAGREAGVRVPPEQTVVDAIRALAGMPTGSWVTFECRGTAGAIEVALGDRRFTVNIPHAERTGLMPRLGELGLALPPNWVVKQDRKKGLFSNGYLELETAESDPAEVVAFVGRAGRKLLGWSDERGVIASFQR